MYLGYHLDDPKSSHSSEEEMRLLALEKEIRRRVYWGAFGSDKVLSLCLGRSPGMHIILIATYPMSSWTRMESWKSRNRTLIRKLHFTTPVFRFIEVDRHMF